MRYVTIKANNFPARQVRDMLSKHLGLRTSRAKHRGDSIVVDDINFAVRHYTAGGSSNYFSIDLISQSLKDSNNPKGMDLKQVKKVGSNIILKIKQFAKQNKIPFTKNKSSKKETTIEVSEHVSRRLIKGPRFYEITIRIKG